MPLDTVLCLDTSGSMGWNNNEGINQLKAAALKFLEGVEETAKQANLKVRNGDPWGYCKRTIVWLVKKDLYMGNVHIIKHT